jgi:hypothetical protein
MNLVKALAAARTEEEGSRRRSALTSMPADGIKVNFKMGLEKGFELPNCGKARLPKSLTGFK